MNALKSGKVIVVDDREDEREALLDLFRKEGIAALSFNGKTIQLPTKPIEHIRVIFADIELGTISAGHSSKTRVGQIVSILNKIIGENNGPYLLCAWTKHEADFDELVNNLKVKPVAKIKMHKSLCRNKNGKFSLFKIRRNFKVSYAPLEAYHLISSWEETVAQSASEIISEICGTSGTAWEENNLKYLGKFAAATLEKQLNGASNIHKYQAALNPFNCCLLDSLERRVPKGGATINFNFNASITDAVSARLNGSLHLASVSGNMTEPGNVYFKISSQINDSIRDIKSISESSALSKAFAGLHPEKSTKNSKNEIQILPNFKEDYEQFVLAQIGSLKLITLECSPVCDFAQNKWLNCILIPGLAVPSDKIKFVKCQDFTKTPVFTNSKLGANPHYLLFDLRRMATTNIQILKRKKPIFRLRRELLSMIQVSLGQRISRQGIISI